jgi:hypothetical protein
MACRTVFDDQGKAVAIACGSRRALPCQTPDCRRDHTALCDYVVAVGKTCDQRMCDVHRCPMGRGLDYCPAHLATEGPAR